MLHFHNFHVPIEMDIKSNKKEKAKNLNNEVEYSRMSEFL